MEVQDDALAIPKPQKHARAGWTDASEAVAEAGDDAPVMGEFGNVDDSDLTW